MSNGIPLGTGTISAANSGSTVPAITPNSAIQCQGNAASGAATLTLPEGLTWSGTVHFYESNNGDTLTQIDDGLILDRSTGLFGAIASGATNKTYQVPTSAGVLYFIASALASGSLTDVVLASGSGSVPTATSLQAVTASDGSLITLGAKADTAATDSTSSWSAISLLKGIWAKLASIATSVAGTLSTIGSPLTQYDNLGSGTTAEIVAGAKKVKKVVGYNYTSSLVYLQLFDALTPSGAPKLCFPVGIGVSNSPTSGGFDYGEDFIQFSTGITYAWSSTPNTYTATAPASQQVQVVYQ